MNDCSDSEMAAPAKKRKAENDDDDDDAAAAGDHESSRRGHNNNNNNNKKNNRNERKRQLEKKRRDEVNNGLDKMMELLFEIDPKSRAESRERQMGTHGGGGGGGGGGNSGNEPADLAKYSSLHALNRVDLIHRSTELLRTLHYENQDLKKLVAELSGGGGGVVGNLPPKQAKLSPPNIDLMVAPPPPPPPLQLQVPRLAAHASLGDHGGNLHSSQHSTYAGGVSSLQNHLERSESAPVALLNALREQRQSLIDKQRSIDASLELIRSGRLSINNSNNNNNHHHLQQPPIAPTAGPRREVSLDFGVGAANSLAQHQAAVARREEEIRLARFTSTLSNGSSTSNGGGFDSHQDSSHVLANLRKNRDDLLEEGSEQSGGDSREDITLAALRQQVSSSYPSLSSRNHHPGVGGGSDLSNEELLARLRSNQAQLANRELLLSGGLGGAVASHRLGGVSMDQSTAAASMSGQDRFLQFQQDNQRLAECLAMEARMPDSLARSRTLDPALLLRHHHHHSSNLGGGGGTGHRRMY